MLVIITIILFVFILAFAGLWIWYFKHEMSNHQNFYALGVNSFKKNEYDKAKDFFLKALAAKPNFKEAQYRLGLVFLRQKDYENAKGCFEKALKAAPKDFDTLFNFAFTLQMQNAYEEAKELYNKALKTNSKDPDCYFNLGFITFNQGDLQKALELFLKAKEFSPNNPQICYFVVKCKDAMCNYETPEEGNAIINEYLQIANLPNLPDSFETSLSRAYAKNGQIDEALKLCQKCLVKQSENVECYTLLGLIQLLKKDLVGAKATLATALSLQSNNSEVHEILSYALCQQQNKCALQKCRDKYKELVQKFIKSK